MLLIERTADREYRWAWVHTAYGAATGTARSRIAAECALYIAEFEMTVRGDSFSEGLRAELAAEYRAGRERWCGVITYVDRRDELAESA